jgi:hypothetical protein
MYPVPWWAGIVSLRAGRSGDGIPLGAIFSAPVQIGPWAFPTSCTVGTGFLWRRKNRRDGASTILPHLAPRLKKVWRCNYSSHWIFYVYVFQVVFLPQGFPHTCHMSCPFQSSLTWSPEWYLVRNAERKVPCYVVFSTPLLSRLS